MLSFITCWRSPEHLRKLEENLRRAVAGMGAQGSGGAVELVVEHDPVCLAAAYNRAMAKAKGELLVFVHDDVAFLTTTGVPRLVGHLEKFDVVGVAGTRRVVSGDWMGAGPPYLYGQMCRPGVQALGGGVTVQIFCAPSRVVGGMAALEGCCLAFRREAIAGLGFDAAAYPNWDGCVMDASYRAFLAGRSLAVACDVGVFHGSDGAGGQGRVGQRLAAMAAFNAKHGLAPGAAVKHQFAAVRVPTIEEAVATMEPADWAVVY